MSSSNVLTENSDLLYVTQVFICYAKQHSIFSKTAPSYPDSRVKEVRVNEDLLYIVCDMTRDMVFIFTFHQVFKLQMLG